MKKAVLPLAGGLPFSRLKRLFESLAAAFVMLFSSAITEMYFMSRRFMFFFSLAKRMLSYGSISRSSP
jgi:hypothetical protein